MDWKKIIADLKNHGYTQQDIADFVGCSQACIGMLASGRRGKYLSFSIAQKILEMKETLPQTTRKSA